MTPWAQTYRRHRYDGCYQIQLEIQVERLFHLAALTAISPGRRWVGPLSRDIGDILEHANMCYVGKIKQRRRQVRGMRRID
jgi:hypothetical protein